MKKLALLLLIFSAVNSQAQKVIPFVDFNYYFRTFENDNFRQLEFQRIKEFKAGDDLVAYIDTKGNLRIYDGKERKDISNLNVEYKVSDHLMAYKIGPTLNMWDEGKLQTLTYFARNYEVKDSLIVFEDTRFNTLNVYWNKQIYPLCTVVDDIYMPEAIGENILVFKDNGNFFKVFYQGEIYDLGVWNNTIDFQCGTDIICFNDPTQRSFAIFENGQFLDVEKNYMGKYKAGRGFIVYEDLNGNLKMYKNGETNQISNFSAKFWEVKDDLVVWGENSFVYAQQNGAKIQVSTYTPKDYLLKNNTFAFRNQMGGVSALIDGKVHEITNQVNAEYEIYGNAVLVKLFNSSYIVFKNGRKFEA
ncbi:MAG: hypothetical protein RI922_453 [Bacteroidota bacterium]|jgi:hypothetical protein